MKWEERKAFCTDELLNDGSPAAQAAYRQIIATVERALTPLNTADKNRLLLAVTSDICATLEALETEAEP